MPPVSSSTAASRRTRTNKLQNEESIELKSKLNGNHQAKTQVSNITESQKRIRMILEKNQERSIHSAGSYELDHMGSLTFPQASVTQRELKSLNPIASQRETLIEAHKLLSTVLQNKQTAIEVTERLYNKKLIKKMRNKSSHLNSKDNHQKTSKSGKRKGEVLTPKNLLVGGEYLTSIKLMEKTSITLDKGSTITSANGSVN